MKNKEHLISEPYTDEEGRLFRDVDGTKIQQIKEKTEADRKRNRTINLWRMR